MRQYLSQLSEFSNALSFLTKMLIFSNQKGKSCTVKLNRVLDWIPQVSDDNSVAGDVVVFLLCFYF